ncbi:MAG: oligosaccharide flippase family protein [Oscillospiraceae bacterium]|nr:oligosaccharide flippase family protein [Oscillospiraceae bacterium]
MKVNTRSALYGATLLSASNILLQLLGFVYRVFVSRLIGAEGMGLFSLVMPAYSVIMAVVVAGLAVSVSRLSAGYQAVGNTRAVAQLTRRAIGVFLALFALAAALIIPLSDGISVWLLGDARTRAGLLALLPCILFTGLENIHKNHFYGLKKVNQPALSEVLEMTVRTVAVIALLTLFKPQYEEYAVALIVAGMVVCEVFSAVLLRIMYRREQRAVVPAGRPVPRREMLRGMAAIAVPISLASLLSNLIGSAGAVMIPTRLAVSGLSASEALSAYGVMLGMSLPLLGLPSAFVAALALVMIPRLSEDLALKRLDAMRRRVGRALRAATLALAPSLTLLAVFGPKLAVALFGQAAAGEHFPLLALGTLLSCYHGVLGSLLSGMGQQAKTAANTIAAGLVQLALIWLLTARPSLRMVGFAWAYVAAALVGAALCALDVRRFLYAPGG